MRLSVKTGLTVTVALLLGFGGTFTTAGFIILGDQERLEEQAARNALDRIEATLNRDATELEGTATEFLQIMALLFAPGQNQTDEQTAALGAALFAANDVDFIFMQATDPATGEVFMGGFQMADGGFGSIAGSLNASVQESSLVHQAHEAASGAFLWGDAPYLAASKPLALPGLVESGGTMIVARALDDADLHTLAEHTSQTVHFAAADSGFNIRRDGLDAVHAWMAIEGPDGPAFGIEVQQPRDVYMRGLLGFLGFLAAAAIMSGGIIVLTLYLLRRFMVSRIQHMSHKMVALQRDDRLADRIQMGGEDELSDMADAFDGLMDTLEQRTKRLDRFASVVSHDLQSPLSTFTLNIALLRRKAQDESDEAAMAQLDRMERTCQHMHGHIRAVLDYSRDKDQGDQGVVQLGQVLDGVLDDMDAELRSAAAEVQRRPLPAVQGDARQIRQVFQNVIQNAIKYRKASEPARIQVQARRRGHRWQIRIRDHGRGFDNGDAPKMVMPFSRLDNTHGADGHGVGLSICAEIIERHGGRLQMQGQRGVGTAVTFDLGAAPAQRPQRPHAVVRAQPQV